MDELEVPTERVQEDLTEHAHHLGQKWASWVALSSAILAVLASITALMAGHHSNEAVIEQIQASDSWAHYQAKAIKSAILSSKMEVLKSLGKQSAEKDPDKFSDYKKEQQQISERAQEQEASSRNHFKHHVIFARGLTFFQVAIAIAAISVLTRKKHFWYLGLGFGAVGSLFLVQGFLSS